MANKKITELAALTDPDANDLLAIVDDPSGSPLTKQITATKLVKSVNNQEATFVVAASDSLHKERADYICDGVDDQVQIQAALDSLNLSGVIQLLEGQFYISASIEWPSSYGIILRGVSGNNVTGGSGLKLTDGANCNMINFGNVIMFAVISDITLHGNKDNQTATSHGINITNSSGHVSDVWVERGIIWFFRDDSIHVAPTNSKNFWNLWLNDFLIEYCGGTALYLDGTNAGNNFTSFFVSNCGFWGNGGASIRAIKIQSYLGIVNSQFLDPQHAIHLEGCKGVLISNTKLRTGTNYDLVYLEDAADGTPCTDINIVDCLSADGNQRYGVNIQGSSDYITVANNNLRYNASGGINIASGINKNGRIYRQFSDLFMDVLAEDDDKIVTAVQIADGALVIAAQSDVPRNVTVKLTDADSSVTSFSVDIVGVNAKGLTITENIAFSGSPGTSTQVGNEAFATITSATVKDLTGTATGDNIQIGIGSKLGLSNIIYATSDIFKVKKDNADYPAASYTVNATYGTVDVSTGGAIGAGNDFTIWYKSNLNILS